MIRRRIFESYEGRSPNVKSLLSSDSVQKVDPIELYKNPKRIRALRPFVQSYRHFTGILAYSMVFTDKSNDDISV